MNTMQSNSLSSPGPQAQAGKIDGEKADHGVFSGAWRKMTGTALLWVALAALINVPSLGGGSKGTMIAVLGFVAFAAGLALFSDGQKREIIAAIRRLPR